MTIAGISLLLGNYEGRWPISLSWKSLGRNTCKHVFKVSDKIFVVFLFCSHVSVSLFVSVYVCVSVCVIVYVSMSVFV